jgi:hypothetical protein
LKVVKTISAEHFIEDEGSTEDVGKVKKYIQTMAADTD